MEEQRICHLKDYINLLVFVGLSTEIELLRLLEWFGMARKNDTSISKYRHKGVHQGSGSVETVTISICHETSIS